MENLTLYEIENQLARLVGMREEAADDLERQTIDEQIVEYLRAEIKKVDRIIPLIRNWEALALARKAEAARLTDAAKLVSNRIDRLKNMILTVMQSAGLKKLEGTTGALLLKANGGKQAVTVTDPGLVPDEMMSTTATMSLAMWKRVREEMRIETLTDMCDDLHVASVPSLRLISEALAGGESVAGCRLEPRGEHVEIK